MNMIATISAAAATAPATVLSSSASIAAAAPAHPGDLRLKALYRDLETVHARMTAAYDIAKKASDRYSEIQPQDLELKIKPPAKYRKLWKTITYSQMKMLPGDHPLVVWRSETDGERARLHAAWRKECGRLQVECGYTAAHADAEALNDEMHQIASEIFATPARSIAGMFIKVQTIKLMKSDPEGYPDWFEALAADITALAKASHTA